MASKFFEAIKKREDTPVWDETPEVIIPELGIDDKPKHWYETLLYAWQHTLVDIAPFTHPLTIALACGLTAEAGAAWINRGLFAMAIATFLMTTIGNKLPIIQGASGTVTAASASVGSMFGAPAMWGAIFVSSIAEFLVGILGLPGLLRKVFPITVSGIVVACIGFSLGGIALNWVVGDGSLVNWLFTILVILCIFALQFLGGRIHPLLSRGAIFFSIILVGVVGGSISGNMDWELVASRPWFAIPTLFPEGNPFSGWDFVPAAIVGVGVGILGSIVESIGDYSAVCAVTNQRYTTRHMNRGIMAEGLGCVIAGSLGALPCTSYTQNIGVISSTKIASRFVVQCSAVIFALYGLCPKFGALIVAIPRSVLGGVFLVVCASIFMSGTRMIAASKPTVANAYTVGLTVLGAVLIPAHLAKPQMADYVAGLNPLVRLILTNTTAFAVIAGIIINQIANHLMRGKDEEKAFDAKKAEKVEASASTDS